MMGRWPLRLKLILLLVRFSGSDGGVVSGFFCLTGMGSCVCNADQLREAVAQAHGPITTTIQVCRGSTITLDEPINLYHKNIQLECPGSLLFLPGQCTIEGDGTGRLFQGHNSVLSIINAKLQKGTAISKSDPDGGAIQLTESFLELSKCNFRDNTALAGAGGAISISDGSLTAVDCTFESNLAQDGAALATSQTDCTVRSSTFENNQSGPGGTWIVLGGSTTIESSSFRKNHVHTAEERDDTGALSVFQAKVSLEQSLFTGNHNNGVSADLFVFDDDDPSENGSFVVCEDTKFCNGLPTTGETIVLGDNKYPNTNCLADGEVPLPGKGGCPRQ